MEAKRKWQMVVASVGLLIVTHPVESAGVVRSVAGVMKSGVESVITFGNEVTKDIPQGATEISGNPNVVFQIPDRRNVPRL